MEIKLLHSFSKNTIEETTWDLPDITEDEVQIEAKITGICRSDIMSYTRQEAMPYTGGDFNSPGVVGTWGHEGVGQITKVGEEARKRGWKLGDYVATWVDPCYGDFYNARYDQIVRIPELHHRFILQPVACAINIIVKTIDLAYSNYIAKLWSGINLREEPILLIGTGFMSVVIGQYCNSKGYQLQVVGSANKSHWDELGYSVKSMEQLRSEKKKYRVIIDLSSKAENWDIITKELARLEAIICYAATPTKPITTNFFENCWDCHNIIMPSPRNSDFLKMMQLTRDLVSSGILKTEFIWSKGYNRANMDEVNQAFEDGANRTSDYVRGYLYW